MNQRPVKILLPLLSVALLLFLLIEFSSCKKSNSGGPTITAPPDTTITSTSVYLDITLDGTRTLGVQNGQTNEWAWGSEWGVPFADTSIFPYNRLGATFISADQSGLPSFSVSKGDLNYYSLFPYAPESNPKYYYSLLPMNAVDSFFMPGNNNYSQLGGDTTITILGDTVTNLETALTKRVLTPGINVMWKDSTGKIWQTFSGTADQTGSFFTITNINLITSELANYETGAFISADFDCKLYDGNGNSKHLTNGKFRIEFLF